MWQSTAVDSRSTRTLENDGTVSLTFHGAATAIYVWLDGTFVGYGEDGFTPSEFDVTEALRNGNGNAADSRHNSGRLANRQAGRFC